MRTAFLALVPLLLAFPAAVSASSEDEVLAAYEDVTVTVQDLQLELELLPPEQRAKWLADAKQLRSMVENMYFRRRMAALADERGYLEEPKVQAILQRDLEERLGRLVPRRYLEEQDEPDFVEEARAYYEENPEEFTPAEEIHLAQILLQAPDEADKERRRSEAEALREKLREGADFAELAREHSEGGARYAGGDMGSMQRGKMVPEFEEVVFSLEEPGEISDVFETRFGLHIVKLIEKPSTEIRPFSEVRERIINRLQKEHRERVLTEWLEDVAPEDKVKLDKEGASKIAESLRKHFDASKDTDKGDD